tara:strand:+ start:455 stop:643 length:189 start_codon:yes stop_codon:yes gene_type:complete
MCSPKFFAEMRLFTRYSTVPATAQQEPEQRAIKGSKARWHGQKVTANMNKIFQAGHKTPAAG